MGCRPRGQENLPHWAGASRSSQSPLSDRSCCLPPPLLSEMLGPKNKERWGQSSNPRSKDDKKGSLSVTTTQQPPCLVLLGLRTHTLQLSSLGFEEAAMIALIFLREILLPRHRSRNLGRSLDDLLTGSQIIQVMSLSFPGDHGPLPMRPHTYT